MISIGLNLILGVLLFCAMVMGARLERRLRALREGHLDFAKAVSELDQAAARTEAGLASLRASSETARTELASRIDQARLACQRLEQLTADADKACGQPLALSHPVAQPATAAQPARTDLIRAVLDKSALTRGEPAVARPAAPPPMRPVSVAVRGRAMFDDDLFDVGPAPERRPSLATMMGARR